MINSVLGFFQQGGVTDTEDHSAERAQRSVGGVLEYA